MVAHKKEGKEGQEGEEEKEEAEKGRDYDRITECFCICAYIMIALTKKIF